MRADVGSGAHEFLVATSGPRPAQAASPGARQSRTVLVEVTVWMAQWQMQCCEKSFTIGSEVAWTLRDGDFAWLDEMLGTDDMAGRVDATEDHHGLGDGEPPATRGTVASIDLVHARYAPSPEDGWTLVPVPGSGTISPVTTADKWVPDRGDMKFVGYLIRLTVNSAARSA